MAVISIPTSIGGVAIPGGLLSGPLGALFGSNKGTQTYSYPADIATSPTRQHSIQFTIKDVEAVNTTDKVQQIVDTSGTFPTLKQNIFSTLKPKAEKIVATVNLYMPDTLNMAYSSDYQDFSLTEAMGVGGKIAQATADAFDSSKGGGGWKDSLKNLANGGAGLEALGAGLDKFGGTQNAGDVLLRATGKAVNPQVQLMYKGISLRSFQLDFLFTPKSKAEAQAAKNIIDIFTYYFAPTLAGAAGGNEGQYFVMPSVFNLKFLFTGSDSAISSVVNSVLGNLGQLGSALAPTLGNTPQENLNIFKVGDCVLTDMNVDYAPNGWASYTDGAPVQTKLSLTFKETDIIHRGRLALPGGKLSGNGVR
jgi:hypothetical protein